MNYSDTHLFEHIRTMPEDIINYIRLFIRDEWVMWCNKIYYSSIWRKNIKTKKLTNNTIPIYYLSYFNFNYSRYDYNYIGKYMNYVVRNDYNYLLDNFLVSNQNYKKIKLWYYSNKKFQCFEDYILFFCKKYPKSTKCNNILLHYDIKKYKFQEKTKRKKKNKMK